MAQQKRKTQKSSKPTKAKSEPKKRGPKPGLPTSLKKRGNPNPLNQFQAGVEHKNKTGAEKGQVVQFDREELEARKLDKLMVARYISQNLMAPEAELEQRLKDPRTSIFEKAIIKIMMTSYYAADQYRMDFLLDRLIGKVKAEVEFTKPKTRFDDMTDDELMREKARLMSMNRVTLNHIETEKGFKPIEGTERVVSDGEQPAVAQSETDAE